ncbi:MAG: hypothetical protein ACYCZM_13100 [Acidimicrobiales bacterium]
MANVTRNSLTYVAESGDVGVLAYANQAIVMEKGTATYDSSAAALECAGDLRCTYLG